MEQTRTISPGAGLLTVTRNLERIADHSTNIAEDVMFLVKGVDVRTRRKPALKGAQTLVCVLERHKYKGARRRLSAEYFCLLIYYGPCLGPVDILSWRPLDPFTRIHFRASSRSVAGHLDGRSCTNTSSPLAAG